MIVYIVVGSALLSFCMVTGGRVCNHKQAHKLQLYTKNRRATLEMLTSSFVTGIYFLYVRNLCRLISVATNLCQIPSGVGRYFIFAIGSGVSSFDPVRSRRVIRARAVSLSSIRPQRVAIN
jgi:hypothetical protein